METQTRKNDERIKTALEGRLEPGENVVTAFVASTRFPYLLWSLVLFPIAFYLDWEQGISPAWVISGSLLLMYTAVIRGYFLVLTDRRLLVLKLRAWSTRHVTGEQSAPRSGVKVSYREAMLSGFLKLEVGDQKLDLQVAKPSRDRAQSLASHLNPQAAPAES